MPKGLVTRTAGKHYHQMVALSKSKRFPDEQVFVENSTYARHNLKRRVIAQKLIPYACAECSITDTWNNKPIILQLEHKNGVNDDNRLSNLGFLCPNCHSQTSTYAARNRKNPHRKAKRY